MAKGTVNKVIILGRLGQDPELRYLPSGAAVANLRVATNEVWKNKETGAQETSTEWHTLVCFGRTAEIAGQYLKKGSSVYVEGKLSTRKWQDKNGQERYSTEVKVDELQLLGGREGLGSPSEGGDVGYQSAATRSGPKGASQSGASQSAGAGKRADFDDLDDDIPF